MTRSTVALTMIVALAAVVAYVEIRLPATVPPDDVDAGSDVRELEARIAALETRDRDAGSAPGRPRDTIAGGVDPSRGSTDGVESGPSTEVTPDAARRDDPAVKTAAPASKAKQVREFLAKVAAGNVGSDEMSKLWDILPGSGLEKEAVEAFRALTAKTPNDPEAHYGLGISLTSSFLGKRTSLMETGRLSGQADGAFSRALELDDEHFGARFSKAIAYTFWPQQAGKGPEAIKHFEILVSRHGNDRSIDTMPTVFFNLGNEYRKAGNLEKAKATYRRGLDVYPDSEAIRKALEAMD